MATLEQDVPLQGTMEACVCKWGEETSRKAANSHFPDGYTRIGQAGFSPSCMQNHVLTGRETGNPGCTKAECSGFWTGTGATSAV